MDLKSKLAAAMNRAKQSKGGPGDPPKKKKSINAIEKENGPIKTYIDKSLGIKPFKRPAMTDVVMNPLGIGYSPGGVKKGVKKATSKMKG
jgi:hypothetical protein